MAAGIRALAWCDACEDLDKVPAATGTYLISNSLPIFQGIAKEIMKGSGLTYNITAGTADQYFQFKYRISDVLPTKDDPGEFDFWSVRGEVFGIPEVHDVFLDTTLLLMNSPSFDITDIPVHWRAAMSSAWSSSGQMASVPMSVYPVLQYCRTDLFKNLSLSPPNTWDELLDIAEKYANKDLDGDGKPEIVCIDIAPACGLDAEYFALIAASLIQLRNQTDGIFFDPKDLRLLLQGEVLRETLRIFRGLRKYGFDDDQHCMEWLLDKFLTGRCLVTIFVPAAFKVSSNRAFRSKVQYGITTTSIPGSRRVLDRTTGQLVPCTPSLCPYADLVVDARTGEKIWVNKVPTVQTVSFAINKYAPRHRQAAAFSFVSTAMSPAYHKRLALSPASEWSPTRYSELELSEWIAWGYEPKLAAAFIAEYRTIMAKTNTYYEPRFPKAFVYMAILQQYLRAGVMAGDNATLLSALEQNYTARVAAMVQAAGGASVLLPLYRRSLGIVDVPPPQPPPAYGQGRNTVVTVAVSVAVSVSCAVAIATAVYFIIRRQRSGEGSVVAPAAGVVTLCVTDIQDSTTLWETLPADVCQSALQLHHGVIRRAASQHNGYESATEGDSFILAFHNITDCTRFALQVQSALLECEWPQQLLASDLAGCVLVRAGGGVGSEESETTAIGLDRAETGPDLQQWVRRACGTSLQALLMLPAGAVGGHGSRPLKRSSFRNDSEPAAARFISGDRVGASGLPVATPPMSDGTRQEVAGKYHGASSLPQMPVSNSLMTAPAPQAPATPAAEPRSAATGLVDHVLQQCSQQPQLATLSEQPRTSVSRSSLPDLHIGALGLARLPLVSDDGSVIGLGRYVAAAPATAAFDNTSMSSRGGSSTFDSAIASAASQRHLLFPGGNSKYRRSLSGKGDAPAARRQPPPRRNTLSSLRPSSCGHAQPPGGEGTGPTVKARNLQDVMRLAFPIVGANKADEAHVLAAGPAKGRDLVSLFRGLRVRVGYHCGVVGPSEVQFNRASQRTVYSGPVLQLAKAVSDAGRGGQITLSAAAREALDPATLVAAGAVLLYSGCHVLKEGQPGLDVFSLFAKGLLARAAYFDQLRSLDTTVPGSLAAPLGRLAVTAVLFAGVAELQVDAADLSGVDFPPLDPTSWGATVARAQSLAKSHQGYVQDAGPSAPLQALFSDAASGVRWALALQREVRQLQSAVVPAKACKALAGAILEEPVAAVTPCVMRAGIHVGELQAGLLSSDGRVFYEGGACKLAGRLAQFAEWREVLVTCQTVEAVLKEGHPLLAVLHSLEGISMHTDDEPDSRSIDSASAIRSSRMTQPRRVSLSGKRGGGGGLRTTGQSGSPRSRRGLMGVLHRSKTGGQGLTAGSPTVRPRLSTPGSVEQCSSSGQGGPLSWLPRGERASSPHETVVGAVGPAAAATDAAGLRFSANERSLTAVGAPQTPAATSGSARSFVLPAQEPSGRQSSCSGSRPASETGNIHGSRIRSLLGIFGIGPMRLSKSRVVSVHCHRGNPSTQDVTSGISFASPVPLAAGSQPSSSTAPTSPHSSAAQPTRPPSGPRPDTPGGQQALIQAAAPATPQVPQAQQAQGRALSERSLRMAQLGSRQLLAGGGSRLHSNLLRSLLQASCQQQQPPGQELQAFPGGAACNTVAPADATNGSPVQAAADDATKEVSRARAASATVVAATAVRDRDFRSAEVELGASCDAELQASVRSSAGLAPEVRASDAGVDPPSCPDGSPCGAVPANSGAWEEHDQLAREQTAEEIRTAETSAATVKTCISRLRLRAYYAGGEVLGPAARAASRPASSRLAASFEGTGESPTLEEEEEEKEERERGSGEGPVPTAGIRTVGGVAAMQTPTVLLAANAAREGAAEGVAASRRIATPPVPQPPHEAVRNQQRRSTLTDELVFGDVRVIWFKKQRVAVCRVYHANSVVQEGGSVQ